MDTRYGKLDAALDRLHEAHWYIHQMEASYHFADPFRWGFNGFVRSIKEAPQIVQMKLQSESGFKAWFQPIRESALKDPLLSHLAKTRDFVVHRDMFLPASSGWIGITEGRGMKMGIGIPINPLENSDDAMRKYIQYIREHGDVINILSEDDDSVPCVQRSWQLAEFPDADLVDLTAQVWKTVGALVSKVSQWSSGPELELALSCRHSSQRVRIKQYDRQQLRSILATQPA